MELYYDGEFVGEIVTNQSLNIEQCCSILGIDLEEMEDENTPKWDYDLFSMDYND
jgi:hypothetical protein